MWNETGGGACRAHPTPAQTQSAGGSVQHQWKSEWCPLEKNCSTPYSISLKASMDEVSNGSCHLFNVSTGMERRVCVPALCSSPVFENPLGATRRSVHSSGSLANWGLWDVKCAAAVPGWAQKDWGSFNCVCKGKAILYPYLYLSMTELCFLYLYLLTKLWVLCFLAEKMGRLPLI